MARLTIGLPYNVALSKVVNLMTGFEEAANKSADILGFGIQHLTGRGWTWMLHALSIQLNAPLQVLPFEIRTWPSGLEKMFVYRDFEIWQNSQLIGRASSSWLVVDSMERKIVVDQDFLESLAKHERPHVAPRPERIRISEDNLLSTYDAKVDGALLDSNDHLNNKYYVEMALKGMGVKSELKSLDMLFRSEAILDEQLQIFIYGSEKKEFYHKIISKKDGRLVASGRSTWT